MEWNWLLGLIYGSVSGLFEFLPVSPRVHQQALLKLTGASAPGHGISLAIHLGALAAVIFAYLPTLSKFARERKIARQPKHRRRRQPDGTSLMYMRLLKISAVPVLLSCIFTPWLSYINRMWVLAILTVINGVVVMLPHYMVRANKDVRTLSPLDATLVGMGGMLSAIPGFSRVGAMTAVSSMRGMDWKFGLDFAYLLYIPVLAVMCIMDLGMLLFAQEALTWAMLLPGVLACAGAFAFGVPAIRLMNFLAVKNSYEGFAYYNWGLAMFIMILYLIG